MVITNNHKINKFPNCKVLNIYYIMSIIINWEYM